MDFATGAGGAAAGELAGTVGNALGSVDGVVSSLNGIQQSLPLDSLTGPALDAFNGVQNTGRNAANWLTSAGQVLEGFDGLTPEVQQTAKENIKDFAREEGPLDKAREAFEHFQNYPWDQEGLEEQPGSTEAPDSPESPRPTRAPSQEQPRQESPGPEPEEPTLEESTKEVPVTEIRTEERPTTRIRTVEVPTTEVRTKELPTTELRTEEVPTTVIQTTQTPQGSEAPVSTLTSEAQTGASADLTSSAAPSGNLTLSSSNRVSESQATEIPATETPQQTERPTTTASSAEQSETALPGEEKIPYFICSRAGTAFSTFEQFVNDLDGGVGVLRDLGEVGHQSYVTDLTTQQAAGLKQENDFILSVFPNTFDPEDLEDEDDFNAIATNSFEKYWSRSNPSDGTEARKSHIQQGRGVSISARAKIPPSQNTPYWKKMIAQPPAVPPNAAPPLVSVADDSGGRGTTIYILDDGFDLNLDVSRASST
jgi:hypothetical protein